jgi:hypothetical protein
MLTDVEQLSLADVGKYPDKPVLKVYNIDYPTPPLSCSVVSHNAITRRY